MRICNGVSFSMCIVGVVLPLSPRSKLPSRVATTNPGVALQTLHLFGCQVPWGTYRKTLLVLV